MVSRETVPANLSWVIKVLTTHEEYVHTIPIPSDPSEKPWEFIELYMGQRYNLVGTNNAPIRFTHPVASYNPMHVVRLEYSISGPAEQVSDEQTAEMNERLMGLNISRPR